MTDMTGSAVQQFTSVHTSNEARERLAKRYRTEGNFKWIGRAAIGVSVAFLLLLLSSVVSQGLPAFTFNFVSMPFEVTAARLGTDGSDERALKDADYDSIIRDAIRSEFPEVTSRNGKRALGGILSSGSSVYLRQQVLDNPAVVGTGERLEVPISDFADLYLKGQITDSVYTDGASDLKIEAQDDGYRLIADGPAFADLLGAAKIALASQAATLRVEQAGALRSQSKLEGDISALQERIPNTDDLTTKDRLEKTLAKTETNLGVLLKRIERLQDQAAALDERVANKGLGETLTDTMPSGLIYLAQGVLKLTSVTTNTATATAYFPVQEDLTELASGTWKLRTMDVVESNRKFSDQEIVWTDKLVDLGYVRSGFNSIFFTRGASREPEMAGVLGAAIGSALTLIITLALSFPLGVAAAIYLEEFAPKNRWTTLIEVNINNLAAVPSIVFGLLGLAVFLNYFHLDRSAPYVGGMVLALMTLPTIIIASRAALRAVPPSIREAALGIGASRLQTVTHHVLPLAMPGILTGTIIGMAQALGETAPLLMIGMVAFVVDVPTTFSDPSTVLPVQIFMWADFPEPAFQQRTSAAIMVLLAFLIAMNAIAVVLRKRFERRW
ncbi:phosphate ABC transporter permease PstA [Maritalea sp.]|uniref:phosphate ABC transporter permease PstA n=1 Tax=Maritalea sp. TaxID=2003361 RepID=UPI003EF26AF8